MPTIKDNVFQETICLSNRTSGSRKLDYSRLMLGNRYLFGLIYFLFSGLVINAQSFTLPNAYAHNDYRHKRPLLDALENGFTYVEADVYLRNGKLIVAHILPCFKKKRTLEELYFKPLLAYVDSSSKESPVNKFPLTLIIDIKSDANKTYEKLELLLEKYKAILSEYANGSYVQRQVTVIITGHKPYDLINSTVRRLAFLDEDLRSPETDISINVYPIASCKYSRLIKWKGKGNLSDTDIQRLQYYVAQAHKNGRKVRLWASPENKSVWTELLKYNVDLINTNRLKTLRKFLISDMLWATKKG